VSTAATRVLIRAAEACAARPEPHEVAALIEALVDRVIEHRGETYPPQVRAPVVGMPIRCPTCGISGSGAGCVRADCRRYEAPSAADDAAEVSACTTIPTRGNLEDTRPGYPAITHAEGSPLLRPQDDFGRRHAARLDRREAWERGPIIPRRTEDRA
jgi:hypothetical protein